MDTNTTHPYLSIAAPLGLALSWDVFLNPNTPGLITLAVTPITTRGPVTAPVAALLSPAHAMRASTWVYDLINGNLSEARAILDMATPTETGRTRVTLTRSSKQGVHLSVERIVDTVADTVTGHLPALTCHRLTAALMGCDAKITAGGAA